MIDNPHPVLLDEGVRSMASFQEGHAQNSPPIPDRLLREAVTPPATIRGWPFF